jgi:hypothetical protein
MPADIVPGPFELHSLSQPCAFPGCIVNLRLPADQLQRHMQCSPEWQQQPVLTDADITARATRLGLLPANTLAAQGVCGDIAAGVAQYAAERSWQCIIPV